MLRAINLLAVGLVCLGLAGCEPKDRRPGLWLSGEVASPPTDWSFVADYPEVFVETRPWYGIPFSVTVVAAPGDGVLYVPSIYEEELPFPGTKYWNSVIAENPNVRMKIGDRIYEMRAVPVQDLTEFRKGARALAAKYPSWANWLDNEDQAPPFVIIRMEPR